MCDSHTRRRPCGSWTSHPHFASRTHTLGDPRGRRGLDGPGPTPLPRPIRCQAAVGLAGRLEDAVQLAKERQGRCDHAKGDDTGDGVHDP